MAGTKYYEESVGAEEGALSEVIKTLSLFVQTNTALADGPSNFYNSFILCLNNAKTFEFCISPLLLRSNNAFHNAKVLIALKKDR